MKKILLLILFFVYFSSHAMATSYTAPFASAATGGFIFASQWNANQTVLESFLNNQNLDGTTNIAVGGIQTANIANLAVTDTKIAGITTAGKVNGSSITSINSLPSGAGVIPTANLGSGSASAINFLRGDQTWNNPFAYYVKVSEVESQNTSGGSSSSGAWTTRVLNTKDSDTSSIASLSSNQVTLPAGTYIVRVSAPFFGTTGEAQIRLQNITASSTILTGQTVFTTANVSLLDSLSGIFTLSGTSALAVQYQSNGSQSSTGLGEAGNFGQEVYTVAEFQKVS